MAEDLYAQTNVRAKGVDDAKAVQYNSLMSELMAGVEGISSKDISLVLTNTGGSSGTLLSLIVITDNTTTDSKFKIDCTITYTYDGSDQLIQTFVVFDNLNFGLVETYTYTSGLVTAIARTITIVPAVSDTVTVAESVSLSIT